ncbi:MAG: glycoside hydrolase family 13 protein [Chlorobi bacterium]|nr:glycoside hydrolase family 13 protein [Chlorobiota bacterium]
MKIIFLYLIIFLIAFNIFGQKIKIEPAFWWVNMNNPKLQLLVYARNISTYEVSIRNKNIELVKINKVENPNYLFLDLIITKKASAGVFNIDFTNKANKKITYKYELKKRQKPANEHVGFNSSDVIYLVMPDRFSNGNIKNDSPEGMMEKADRENPDGRHGGDLQGIINHLDYISNLGVTAIWLNPFQENNRPQYSYHGYATTNFYKTDPRFGTNKDYKHFVNECHNKNLKVIIDIVLNHCDTNNWLIKDLPSPDWIHQFPEFTRTNYRIPAILDPHGSEYDRNLMLNGWFDQIMADLNHKNPFLATYLIQNTIWWIEYAGIDGIRLDTQPYSDKDFVAGWAKQIFNEYPNFNIVGEAWLQKIALTAYWQKNANNTDGYNSNIPSVTDFPLCFAIASALNEHEGWAEGMNRLYYILAQDFLYAHPENNLIFVDNHDLTRFYQSIGGNLDKFKMGLAFLLTTRGIPMIYYGTELAMGGSESEGHGYIRKDFPGGWPNDKNNAFVAEGRSNEQNETFNYLQNILNWRKNAAVISTGKLMQFLPENNIYVYFRYNQNKTVMVVLNNNDSEQTIKTERYNEAIKGNTTGFDIIMKKQIDHISEFSIAPKSAMIIELSE